MSASGFWKAVGWIVGMACLAIAATVMTPAAAQPPQEDWNALYASLTTPTPTEFPSLYKQESGFLRFLGAPEGAAFSSGGGSGKSDGMTDPAAAFLNRFASLFGLDYAECSLSETRRIVLRNMEYVRFSQYYQGLPVEGAEVVVQVDATGNIQSVSASALTSAEIPAGTAIETVPVLLENQAAQEALNLEARALATDPESLRVVNGPELIVFAPGIFGLAGSPVLAWKVGVSRDPARSSNTTCVYISAADGGLLLRHSQHPGLLQRTVYDVQGNANLVGSTDITPARTEGQGATGNTAVDNTYDYFGDTYNFYFNRFNVDSYDGEGSALVGYVNAPVLNAFWDTEEEYMILDSRLLADDIVAHELSHGYTLNVTNFIYFSFSGALAELYADWGGEFVDLTNGRGNDDDNVRWWIGEDMQLFVSDQRGRQEDEDDTDVPSPLNTTGVRYMKDPTVFGNPDRLGSPLLADPTSLYDNGGVHINSGIGSKFVYLLTDGDQFNGESVQGIGIDKVADLMFNTLPKLPRSATYYDFFYALGKTSSELGFTLEERSQVLSAARAVEIEPPEAALLGLSNLRAIPVTTTDNEPAIALTWQNPTDISIGSLVLVRSVNGYTTNLSAGLVIPLNNNSTSYVDTAVQSGVTYYYTLIGDLSETFPQLLYAKATAGGSAPNLLTQVFGNDPQLGQADQMDLSYTQITFKPAIDPAPPLGQNAVGVSYEDYRAIVRRNVFSLPVQREDANGGAFRLPLTTDGTVSLKIPNRIPYFGKRYDNLVLGANGYIAFLPGIDQIPELNQPSAAAHFVVPRISFLFSDLAPDMSGEVWGRFLDDRVVFTFMEIPSANDSGVTGYETPKNTVQTELFYDGTIRITYQYIGATNAVVGLSDGRGAPTEPSTLWTNVKKTLSLTKFTALPSSFNILYIEPIPYVMASGGETVRFTARAVNPAGVTGVPALTAEWTGTGRAPFADLGNGTGEFSWDTPEDTVGEYTVRVYALLGSSVAWQDVSISVGFTYLLPTAQNLSISANTPYEDPFQSRLIPLGSPLSASYEYYHPLSKRAPDLYSEGDTIIYWFRNGQIVPELLGRLSVPAPALRSGDRWWFGVIPVAAGGYYGELVQSPVVTVDGFPKITAVVPNYGLTIGGETVTIQGRQLSRTVKVYFGGVPATNLRVLSDEAIQVTVPLHEAGRVDVVCESPEGTGILNGGYRYISDYRDLAKEDLNKDGRIDAVDVQLATNAILKLVALPNADVNGDKKVDVKDVQLVVKRALLH